MTQPSFLILDQLDMGRRNLGEQGHYTFLSRLYTTIEQIGLDSRFTILNYGRGNGSIAVVDGQDYNIYRVEKHPRIQVGEKAVKGYHVLGSVTGTATGKLKIDKKNVATLGHGYFKAERYPILTKDDIQGWVYVSDVTDLGKKWDPHCALYLDEQEERSLPSILLSKDVVHSILSTNLEGITLHAFMEQATVKSAPLIVEYKPQGVNGMSDILMAHGDSVVVPYDETINGLFATQDNGTGVEVLLRVLKEFKGDPMTSNQNKGLYWVFTFDEETTRLQARHAIEQIKQMSAIEYVINVDTISHLGNLAVRTNNQDNRFKALRRKLLGDAKVFSISKYPNSDIEFAANKGHNCYDFLTIGRDPKLINGISDIELPSGDEHLERVVQFILQMRKIK